MDSDAIWDDLFASTGDVLDQWAEEAIAERKAGKTISLPDSFLPSDAERLFARIEQGDFVANAMCSSGASVFRIHCGMAAESIALRCFMELHPDPMWALVLLFNRMAYLLTLPHSEAVYNGDVALATYLWVASELLEPSQLDRLIIGIYGQMEGSPWWYAKLLLKKLAPHLFTT